MTSQFITRNEIEGFCEEELQSKFSALVNNLMRTQAERTFALASLETVEAELNRKRALKAHLASRGASPLMAVFPWRLC